MFLVRSSIPNETLKSGIHTSEILKMMIEPDIIFFFFSFLHEMFVKPLEIICDWPALI